MATGKYALIMVKQLCIGVLLHVRSGVGAIDKAGTGFLYAEFKWTRPGLYIYITIYMIQREGQMLH